MHDRFTLGRPYAHCVIAMGSLAIASAAVQTQTFHWLPFATLLVLGSITSGFRVRLPKSEGSFSIGYICVLLGFLELSLIENIAVALAGAAVQVFRQSSAKPGKLQLAFNLSLSTVAVTAASRVWAWHPFGLTHIGQLGSLGLTACAYYLMNTLASSNAVAFQERRRTSEIWWRYFAPTAPYYIVGASVAEMICLSARQLGPIFIAVIVPVIYATHRTYRVYLDQLLSQRDHAEGMAAVHLRTIEALALAIEAKDECTGEHLRRVQVYSLSMAEKLGLSHNERLALQAASILHDIGKLAVPDYIISKPGRLTPEEFARMKIHPSVGAEILDRVAFPYPVAPIVRAHHEKWNGSGYPNGLKGEEIPIGARILSAVDCLDALASDRQYRRALPLDEAMQYVLSEAGKSFDPNVVAILAANVEAFEEQTRLTPIRPRQLHTDLVVWRGAAPDAGFESTAKPAGPVLSDAEQAAVIDSIVAFASMTPVTLQRVMSRVDEQIQPHIPHHCIALYALEKGELHARYVAGQNSSAFSQLRIPLGQGLSGWVLENSKSIVNGDPSVELGYLGDPSKFSTMRAGLAAPIHGPEGFRAVLAIYHLERDAFSRTQLKMLEALAGRLDQVLWSAATAERQQATGTAADLSRLYAHLEASGNSKHRPAERAGKIAVS